ncbi:cupin domain-containing protein [Vagococcus sp. JNUCC 83]
MKVKKTEDKVMNIFFDETNQKNKRVKMGLIRLQPGEKIPDEGYSRHEQDEFSYVLKGECHTILEDGQDILALPGDAQLIEANEGHINYNSSNEVAEVVWMLVDREEK